MSEINKEIFIVTRSMAKKLVTKSQKAEEKDQKTVEKVPIYDQVAIYKKDKKRSKRWP